MPFATPLYEIESAAGASFESYCGWEVAALFGDSRAEYDALCAQAGVLDMCFLGKLRATGRDRQRFLNNMLTNDIKNLAIGSGCYAALLTRQGLMESDLWVYACAEELWLECPPCAGQQVLASLRKHIVSDAVDLDDHTEPVAILSIQGPKAGDVVERTLGISVPPLGMFEHRVLETVAGGLRIVRRDRTGFGGYDLWLPRDHVAEIWSRCIENEGVRAAGFEALNWARTEAGIPWYGADMDDRTLPMEMGLDAAINMKKGCYLGQEIVARITLRGHLERRLAGIVADRVEPPAAGTEVHVQGSKIGTVTSAILSPRLRKPLALAVIKTAFLQPGTPVELACGEGKCRGEVVQLPLPHPWL
jgi:folate-binding protein YgfZ